MGGNLILNTLCRRDMAENFRTQILNSRGESSSLQTPVRTLGSCTFMYLRHSDLYMLMVTKNNANVMMAFKFMTSVSMLSYSFPVAQHCSCRMLATAHPALGDSAATLLISSGLSFYRLWPVRSRQTV